MSQNKIFLFEVEDKAVYIESSVRLEPGTGGFIAADAGETMTKATTSLERSLDPILDFAKTFVKRIGNLEIEKPAEVELEFGIKLSGAVNCWVISGQGEGAINLKLTWSTK
ncbi:hypothetical protein GFS24_01305 [Chitinophaga sp. SYP-B3965]|uniref:CU044_2847 family protein n=1 Tax=Chitinophaga sp. SYP-B3965 TaxID=2663120 RepID=UPI001299740E|nr:CU044_2847 family protein [Chitinophaga sp. SYP-B3965]MRG43726.1 hypothetical protein [Chitinophaga sp. SYP-B3965]